MIDAITCPFGKIYCDGCNYLGTGGCYNNEPVSFSITKEQQQCLYDVKFEELMQLPKEKLVGMILGARPV